MSGNKALAGIDLLRDYLDANCNGHPDCPVPHDSLNALLAAFEMSLAEISGLESDLREAVGTALDLLAVADQSVNPEWDEAAAKAMKDIFERRQHIFPEES